MARELTVEPAVYPESSQPQRRGPVKIKQRGTKQWAKHGLRGTPRSQSAGTCAMAPACCALGFEA